MNLPHNTEPRCPACGAPGTPALNSVGDRECTACGQLLRIDTDGSLSRLPRCPACGEPGIPALDEAGDRECTACGQLLRIDTDGKLRGAGAPTLWDQYLQGGRDRALACKEPTR